MEKIKRAILFHAKSMQQILAFLLGSSFIYRLHTLDWWKEYRWDAGDYWYGMALSYNLDKFSIYNYNNPLRGYLYPLMAYALHKLAYIGIGAERLNFFIATSILYTFCFMVLIPKIIKLMFEIDISIPQRLIYSVICTIMFRGMILYPLTDLPGIMLVCLAIYFFLLLMKDKVKRKWMQVLYAGGIGVGLGGAYYVRPVYLIVWLAFSGMAITYMIRTKKWTLSVALLGMLIVAMPQICINKVHFNTYSPMIQTQSGVGKSLYLRQLEWGIYVQKYESNMDEAAKNIPAAMIYEDSIGTRLLEQNGEIDSYLSYIKFCIRHFADMACIYLKHIFNGLDIVYPDAYIKNVYCNRFMVQFFNYTLIFGGLEGLLFFIKRKMWNGWQVGLVITYCLPIMLVIPTAVETRFFVGAHLVLYLFAVITLINREWWRKVWKCKWKAAGVYVMFLCVCFLMNSQTFNCYGIPLW